MRRFMSVVDDVLTSQGACSIIDVGGTVPYWAATEAIWGSKNISVVIINFAES